MQSRCPEIVQAVCKVRGVDVNALDNAMRTCVHYMAGRGEEKDQLAVLKVLHKNGLHLQSGTQSALWNFLNVSEKAFTCIDWLLENGADPLFMIGDVRPLDLMRRYNPSDPAKKKEMIRILDRRVPRWEEQ